MWSGRESFDATSKLAELLDSGCVLQTGQDRFVLGLGLPTRSSKPDLERFSLYTPDFHLEDLEPWRIYPRWVEVSRAEFGAWMAANRRDSDTGTPAPLWESPRQGPFRACFEDIQERILTGDLKKAVAVVFTRSHFEIGPRRLGELLQFALTATRQLPLNIYGQWSREGGLLGATPELLFRAGEREVETVALAGTRPHLSDRPALLEDPKELAEHRWVIDGIRRALESFGEVRVGRTRELALPTFSHLLTPIHLETCSPLDFEQVARAIHPTPALGAFPREDGLAWLRAQAWAKTRRRFGAPFGATWRTLDGPLSAQCWVAIRNIQWHEGGLDKPHEVILGAGCGIIAESVFEREWGELAVKTRAVQAVLGL